MVIPGQLNRYQYIKGIKLISKSLSAPHQIKKAITKLPRSSIQSNSSNIKTMHINFLFKNTLQLVQNISLFQKVEDGIRRTSLNNTFSEFTLKYFFSLISIRSVQESKTCSNERGSSQQTQKGGSSPFNNGQRKAHHYIMCIKSGPIEHNKKNYGGGGERDIIYVQFCKYTVLLFIRVYMQLSTIKR